MLCKKSFSTKSELRIEDLGIVRFVAKLLGQDHLLLALDILGLPLAVFQGVLDASLLLSRILGTGSLLVFDLVLELGQELNVACWKGGINISKFSWSKLRPRTRKTQPKNFHLHTLGSGFPEHAGSRESSIGRLSHLLPRLNESGLQGGSRAQRGAGDRAREARDRTRDSTKRQHGGCGKDESRWSWMEEASRRK